MQRRHYAAIASLLFSIFWAASMWLWSGGAHRSASASLFLWSLCALFLLVAAGLAAARSWARWLGLTAAAMLLVLMSIALFGAYFLSFFGDQAFEVTVALKFLAGIGCAVALVVLLAKPLVVAPAAPQLGPGARSHHVWVPTAFSGAYLIGAWLLSIYASSGQSALARDIGAHVALAVIAPSIVLIWLAWAWWVWRSGERAVGILIGVALVMPIVVTAVIYKILSAKVTEDRRRTAEQIKNMRLSDITDELLLSPHGNPLGIRLRYTLRLGEGLDDMRYRPIASITFGGPMSAMWSVRLETTPSVTGSYSKGEYHVTEEFVPWYFPGFLRFPEAAQRADDRCFSWGVPGLRELAMSTSPTHATISVSVPQSVDGPSVPHRSPSKAYTQIAFYSGARAEGAVDCP